MKKSLSIKTVSMPFERTLWDLNWNLFDVSWTLVITRLPSGNGKTSSPPMPKSGHGSLRTTKSFRTKASFTTWSTNNTCSWIVPCRHSVASATVFPCHWFASKRKLLHESEHNLCSEWIIIHSKSWRKFLLNEFGFQTERGAPFSLTRKLRVPIWTSKHSSHTDLWDLQKVTTYHTLILTFSARFFEFFLSQATSHKQHVHVYHYYWYYLFSALFSRMKLITFSKYEHQKLFEGIMACKSFLQWSAFKLWTFIV